MINLMIIDDEKEVLDMLSKALSRSGKFTISSYTNPKSAISDLKNKKPDIVLTDIMMPELDGLEVLEKVKDFNPESVVVMMTAYSTLDKVLNSHSGGAGHYIMKPFESLSAVESKILSLAKK
ncbi:MAG: response regulator [Campylobacterales bacterium]|nr:response regulator [Campylobacterales bacterium]